MKIKITKNKLHGFTIPELIIIIVIVGILSTISYVYYGNAQIGIRDSSVQSDIEAVAAAEKNYLNFSENSTAKAWYSGDGVDTDLKFTPSEGNVIDVTANGSDYCIRGMNPEGTKNSIFNAFIKESNIGVCDGTEPGGVYPDGIDPSPQAIADYSGPKLWMRISTSDVHTCGIASDAKAYCMGWNGHGELGDGTTNQKTVPTAVNTSGVLSGKTIKYISVGDDAHTCAVSSDNKGYCWGYNYFGQSSGDGTFGSDILLPTIVNTTGTLNSKPIISISAGMEYTCGINSDKQAYCWGRNDKGQLGNNSTNNSATAVAIDTNGALSGKTIKSISAGRFHTCAVASDNKAYCWGWNGHRQLGDGTGNDSSVPVAVDTSGALSGKTIKSISVGESHTCVVASDNKAYCWGYNWYGNAVGNGTQDTPIPIPTIVNTTGTLNNKTVKSISASQDNRTCAINSDYKVYCWGYNIYGVIGCDGNENWFPWDQVKTTAIAVKTSGLLGGKMIKHISTGKTNTCVIDTNYHAYCWGKNGTGELGIGITGEQYNPVAVNTAP